MFNLKIVRTLYLLVFIVLFILTIAPLYVNTTKASPEKLASLPVDAQVEHVIDIHNEGLVIINDTIRLFTKPDQKIEPISNLLVGFPFEYGSNLDYVTAYGESGKGKLNVNPNVETGMVGYNFVNVSFLEPVDISEGKSYNFTVVFIFSDLVYVSNKKTSITSTTGEIDTLEFTLNFPMYPSIPLKVSACNVTVLLPLESNYVSNSLIEEGVNFSETNSTSYKILTYTKIPLEDLAYKPSWLKFEMKTDVAMSLIEINELRQNITLNEWGQILSSNDYEITNKEDWILSSINIDLPQDAKGISAMDELGPLTIEKGENQTSYNLYTITLQDSRRSALNYGEKRKFSVIYSLPWENYTKQSGRDFRLIFSQLVGFNSTIRRLIINIELPEGANFYTSSIKPDGVQRNVFTETVTYVFQNVTTLQILDFDLPFQYTILWASFRPTLWMGVAVIIVSIVILFLQVSKPTGPSPIIPINSENLSKFVDAYEEKRRVFDELAAMEQQADKGKIPRRQYKIRRRTLENRLAVLSRDLSSRRENIQEMGPRFGDLIRQIEVAETELEGIDTDIRRVDTRFRSGEIAKAAYNKLLEEYRRREDKAKTLIEEALLRLKEEIT